MPAGCAGSVCAESRRRRATRVSHCRGPGKRARWLLVSAGRPRAYFHVVVVGGPCIVITGGGRYLSRGGSVTDALTPRCYSHVLNDGGGSVVVVDSSRSDGGGNSTTVQSAARVPYRVARRPDHQHALRGRRRSAKKTATGFMRFTKSTPTIIDTAARTHTKWRQPIGGRVRVGKSGEKKKNKKPNEIKTK